MSQNILKNLKKGVHYNLEQFSDDDIYSIKNLRENIIYLHRLGKHTKNTYTNHLKNYIYSLANNRYKLTVYRLAVIANTLKVPIPVFFLSHDKVRKLYPLSKIYYKESKLKNLYKLLFDKDIKISDLDKLGIKSRSIYHVLHNNANLSPEITQKLADILEVPVTKLWSDRDIDNPHIDNLLLNIINVLIYIEEQGYISRPLIPKEFYSKILKNEKPRVVTSTVIRVGKCISIPYAFLYADPNSNDWSRINLTIKLKKRLYYSDVLHKMRTFKNDL